ncbi:endoplasmic reticulum membrane sensor NFE2L1-like isoform X1 [Hemibagrus wyckioides]|uniref:endoplasmic reticulum membrane sensor NFE2L1-like isoform X1 n=1 Tax=Hemibagrus wyckioides TaxID=337641 RepID=UPI00266D1264|nr:endoplasmic reticulum membrane sensor NFE2L1-like isoform X1 [Hemibagrus wyckioides]
MQHKKKCFMDCLIQLTILLSFIGVRVDVNSYLNSPFHSPLIEINAGQISTFVQTPFHYYRDIAAGHHVYPKCTELEDYFTSRRLLNQVRALGSPVRFPTRLSAWLLHLVPNGVEPEEPPNNNGYAGEEDSTDETRENESYNHPETIVTQTEDEIVKDNEEGISLDSATQLIQSSVLEQEALLSNSVQHQNEGEIEVHPQWPDFLSDFTDFESFIAQHVPDMDPISYNASLHDAMVNSGGNCRPDPLSSGTYATLFSLESINTSNRETPRTAVGALALPPFSSLGNSFHGTSHSTVGGYLDEAVFEQINLLGLEGLAGVEGQVLNPWLEDLDSDSGLSLETNSRSPASASMSSSESFCDGGAMGYSSEVESLLCYGAACASSCYDWPQVILNNKIWHDHNYSAQSPDDRNPQSWSQSPKIIKQEVMSEDETGLEEPSRDEQRLQALGLPFSAPEIVNMPVEHFLELLDGRSLSTSEVTLLRDVRRRGKNKLAAQNCRKRKLHAILGLQAEVERLVTQRDALLHERTCTTKALSATAECYKKLSHAVLSQLRDEHGQTLSPEQYTLDCGTNEHVVVRPRTNAVRMTSTRSKTTKRKKDKKR